VTRGQCRELVASNEEERIGADDESAGLPLHEGCESGVDLGFAADLQDKDLYPLRACRRLHLADNELGTRAVRIHEQTHYPGLGSQLGQQFEPLGQQLDIHVAHTSKVAARPRETGDQSGRGWVAAEEDDRVRRGCVFCHLHGKGAGGNRFIRL
jgi:hypothetical protein